MDLQCKSVFKDNMQWAPPKLKRFDHEAMNHQTRVPSKDEPELK